MKHHELCEGELTCPTCKRDTCGKVVNRMHLTNGEVVDVTVICLFCFKPYNVGG